MIRAFLLSVLVTLLVACSTNHHEKQKNDFDFDASRAAQARVNLAMAYLSNDNLHLALRNLQKALEFDEKSEQAQLAMALYEQKVGDINAANERYKKLLVHAKNSVTLNYYGVFLCSTGHYKQALDHFREALDLNDRYYIDNVLLNAGLCAIENNDTEAAVALYHQLLKRRPEYVQHILLMIDRYLEQRDYNKVSLLLTIYEANVGVNAVSLGYRITVANYEHRTNDVIRYGEQLAQDFPFSEEYRRYLNEY